MPQLAAMGRCLVGMFGILAVAANPSWTCSCDTPTPLEALEKADAVFKGTAIRVEHRRSTPAANWLGEGVIVTFRVSGSWKGIDRSITTLITGGGGGDCGFEFVVGTEYVVFAYKVKHSTLATHICTPTAPAGTSALEVLGPVVRQFDTFEGLSELRRAVRSARRVSLYRGVSVDPTSNVSRCDSTNIVAVRGHWFHAKKKQLKGVKARALADYFERLSFASMQGEKICRQEGQFFNPQYCLEWRVEGETHNALVSLDCPEVQYVGPHVVATVDLSPSDQSAIEELLGSHDWPATCSWDRPPPALPDLYHGPHFVGRRS